MKGSKRCGVVALLSLLVPLGWGCESSEEQTDHIGTSQAQAIWSATDRALQALESKLLAELKDRQRPLPDGGLDRSDGGLDRSDGSIDRGDAAAGSWIVGDLTAFQVDGSVQNPQGSGTATITGMGGKQGSGWGLSLNIALEGWAVDDSTTIDGTLVLSYTLRGLRPPSMTLSVGGTLQVSRGPVTLPAEVQVQVEIEGSQRTVCGAVAGQPVGEGFCNI